MALQYGACIGGMSGLALGRGLGILDVVVLHDIAFIIGCQSHFFKNLHLCAYIVHHLWGRLVMHHVHHQNSITVDDY